MQKITTIEQLRDEILLLENEQSLQFQSIKGHFINVRESLRPANLIKSTFNEAVSSPDIATNVLNAAVGLGMGILSKRMIMGSTRNPFTKLLGTILEAGIATVVTVKGDNIRDSLSNLISSFKRKKADDIIE